MCVYIYIYIYITLIITTIENPGRGAPLPPAASRPSGW